MAKKKYPCPEDCNRSFETVRGWKHHMSAMHNGYTSEQLSEVVGAGQEGIRMSGEASFADYAGKMPDAEAGFSASEAAEEYPPPTEEEEPSKRQRVSARKMRARMEKLKQKLATDVPRLLFQWNNLELDGDSASAIEESVETVFDILGVEFEVEPFELVIRNRLLVLLYPVVVIATIFGIKWFNKNWFSDDNKEVEGGVN